MEQPNSVATDRYSPDTGKPHEHLELERQIRAHHAVGDEPARSEAAWALARLIMRRTLP